MLYASGRFVVDGDGDFPRGLYARRSQEKILNNAFAGY